jgi:DNA polymerase III alpha subunit
MATELRAHSAFSFGDGAVTPEALVTRAERLGYTALGLTDTADLGGTVRFVLEARKRGVKALVGAELEVDGCPIALLARTAEGYRNLASLVTRARSGTLASWRRERPHVPRGMPAVGWADVVERSAGLHALTGPAAGRVASLVRSGDSAGAARHVAQLREVFGHRLAIEVQRHHAGAREAELADALVALAERSGVPWVACQDPRYLDNRSRLVHDMLTALRAGLTLDAPAPASFSRARRLHRRFLSQSMCRGGSARALEHDLPRAGCTARP